MTDTINICYVINERFHRLTQESIRYINKFFKSAKYKLDFYIITKDKHLITDNIHYVYIDHDEPICHTRVRIPELLDVDRCIFLDSDTICMRCISHLWEVNLHDNPLGACKHHIFKTIGEMFDLYRMELDIYLHTMPCFNCGVLLFDCKMWRDMDLTQACMRQFKTYKHSSHYKKDEPAMNVFFNNCVTYIDERWNYCPRPAGVLNPFLLHYYGNFKSVELCHSEF